MGNGNGINIDTSDKNKKELEKHSIYIIETEELNKLFKNESNAKKFDYEFVVIDGRNKKNIFIKFINYFLNDNELGKELCEIIGIEENDEEKKNKIFEYFSKKIEQLPGRIIILGTKHNNKLIKLENKDINSLRKNWIKKRVYFTNEIKLNGQESSIKNDKIYNKLYEIWVYFLYERKDIKEKGINLNFGTESEKMYKPKYILKGPDFKLIYYIFKKFFNNKDEKTIKAIISYIYLDLYSEYLREKPDSIEDATDYMEEFQNILDEKKTILADKFDKEYLNYVLECETFINRIKENYILYEIAGKDNNKYNVDNIIIEIEKTFFNKMHFPAQFLISKNESITKECLDKKSIIEYRHHGEKDINPEKEKKMRVNSKYYYLETLSGASLHYKMINCKNKMLLEENGLYRMLIIDERIADYVGQNYDVKRRLESSGIDVIGIITKDLFSEIEDESIISERLDERFFLNNEDPYDIIIIHQGVLDKIFKNENKEKIEKQMNELKLKIAPYVFVTSGRGKPANIPDNVKFVNFSFIESNLMVAYHQKLILTLGLMKI